MSTNEVNILIDNEDCKNRLGEEEENFNEVSDKSIDEIDENGVVIKSKKGKGKGK